jgi:hypothetical protein
MVGIAILLLTVLTSLIILGCLQAQKQPVKDPYFWDFGQVTAGQVLEHVFTIRNNSSNALIINRLQTSCGCTGSVISRDHIPAGESAEIKVTFNTKGYSGLSQQFVYVHTDDTQNPIIKLTIQAQVTKKK